MRLHLRLRLRLHGLLSAVHRTHLANRVPGYACAVRRPRCTIRGFLVLGSCWRRVGQLQPATLQLSQDPVWLGGVDCGLWIVVVLMEEVEVVSRILQYGNVGVSQERLRDGERCAGTICFNGPKGACGAWLAIGRDRLSGCFATALLGHAYVS